MGILLTNLSDFNLLTAQMAFLFIAINLGQLMAQMGPMYLLLALNPGMPVLTLLLKL